MPSIVIADANELMRECVAALLNSVPEFAVVDQCPDGRRLAESVAARRPDIAIVTTDLPDLDIFEAVGQVRENCPITRVIAFARFPDEISVDDMAAAGVSGSVDKDGTVKDLVEVIRKAVLVRDDDKRTKTNESVGIAGNRHTIQRLTPRECEVLKLIGESRSSKEIASMLKISESTVKTYRNHLMDKLDVRDVAGLTREAVRHRLVRINYRV